MDFVIKILGESQCASSLCKSDLEIVLIIWLGYYKLLDLLDYICKFGTLETIDEENKLQAVINELRAILEIITSI